MRHLIIACALAAALSPARATTIHFDDFTTYTGAGLAPGGPGGSLDSDHWAVAGLSDGDSAFGTTRSGGDFGRGASPGGITAGGLYAFHPDPEGGGPALGFQPTGSDLTPGVALLRIVNRVGREVSGIAVRFTLWVRNDADRSTRVRLGYAPEDASAPGARAIGAWLSPGRADPQPGWQAMAAMATFDSGGLAPGAGAVLAWLLADGDGTGPRDELAIDDVLVEAVSLAAPSSGLLALAGLVLARVPIGRLSPVRALARQGRSALAWRRRRVRPDPPGPGHEAIRIGGADRSITWAVRVNGRAVGTVAVAGTGRRRAVETAAICLPAVCELIGERTVRDVHLADGGVVDIVV